MKYKRELSYRYSLCA